MICILGGTFDPVHLGHLRPALEVQQALEIPCVHLLPCRTPPHRPAPKATPAQRLALLQQAVADEPALAIDDRELRREGPSYMVDTLHSLREDLGEEALCLALGSDAFAGLESWHRWQEIPGLCHLVVMQRPGSAWPREGRLAQLVDEARVGDIARLKERPAGHIVAVPVTQLDISSTRIRALLAAGRSARYLAPDSVIERIRTENWYAD
ncbi:MAG TPA: nicotinate-nucleotide adenylyltransferase [Gammaproteobacteria bacterium]|nr:nicotinate-nucleotide adenylyltransferase [Gammaproteobacteria bacterium]